MTAGQSQRAEEQGLGMYLAKEFPTYKIAIKVQLTG